VGSESATQTGRAVLISLAVLVAVALAACSPEAGRARSGGPGADVGNRTDPRVEPIPQLHPILDPAFHTPKLGQAIAK